MRSKTKRKQPRVIVFTTPTCGYCQAVKRYLRTQSIRFKEVDISRDAAAVRDIVHRTGRQGVPVTYIGNKFVVGFDRPKIDKLIGLV